MLDDDDLHDDATRALNELLGDVRDAGGPSAGWIARWAPDGDVAAAIDRAWCGCTNASLLLAVAERLAPRGPYLLAVAACARDALPARSAEAPQLVQALATVEACARGEATAEQAREASNRASSTVSRMVAGVDDDVGLAVMHACDLAAGDAFDFAGPDPPFSAAWAWACHDHDPSRDREAANQVNDRVQAELAHVVRRFVPTVRMR